MSIDLMDSITPLLVNLITIIISIIGVIAVGLLNKFKIWVTAKIGSENYNRAREVAIGLYSLLEDEFRGMADAGAEKRAKMEQLLLAQFPTLTQTELDAINKEVCSAIKTESERLKLFNNIETDGIEEEAK